MNQDTKTLWISLFSGALAVFLVYSYSQENKAQLDKKFSANVRVIVAAKDIAEMQTIDDTMITTKEIPEDFLQPNYTKNTDEVIGQVAGIPIKAGEQILLNKLLSPGPETGIALQVSPTKRAVTIPVDEMRAVAKLIRPGDRVDILASLEIGKGINARREVSTILSDVPVLATGLTVINNLPRIFEIDPSGKSVSGQSLVGDTKYSTITVEADPQKAQDLVYILSTSPGNIFFLLRNPNDRGNPTRLPSSIESITGKSMQAATSTPGAPGAQQPGGVRAPSFQQLIEQRRKQQ